MKINNLKFINVIDATEFETKDEVRNTVNQLNGKRKLYGLSSINS